MDLSCIPYVRASSPSNLQTVVHDLITVQVNVRHGDYPLIPKKVVVIAVNASCDLFAAASIP